MAEYHPDLSQDQEDALVGCSSFSHYALTRAAFECGLCPFCHLNHNINTVLYNRLGWKGWEVGHKFTTRKKTLDLQFLLFPARHVDYMKLTILDKLTHHLAEQWLKRRYSGRLVGGGLITRFGPTRYNVGTIPGHCHVNYFVPNLEGGVIVPLAKEPEMLIEHSTRMLDYMKRYDNGERPD